MGLGFESQADHDDLYIRHNVRFLRTIRFRIVRFFLTSSVVAGVARQFPACIDMDHSESPRKGTLFLYCRYRSSGLRAPAARPTRGVFHGLDPMKKRMICCTSILKVRLLPTGITAEDDKIDKNAVASQRFCLFPLSILKKN